MDISIIALSAGIAIGLPGLGVALSQGRIGGTALELIGKSPRGTSTLLMYTVLGVALVESAAIYGLVIAFQILGLSDIETSQALGAAIAIGLTGFGAGYGEGRTIEGALLAYNRNPEMKNEILQYMVLFIALAETAAIYGLVVAFRLLS